MLTGACQFRHAASQQTTEWADELSVQRRELATALRGLRRLDRKTALRQLVRAVGRFLRETFLLSPARLLRQRLGRRTLGFMFAGVLPLLAAGLLIAVPALLFNHPDQRTYFFFANILRSDAASLIPLVLGVFSLVVVLRIPLQSGDPGHHA